MRARLLGLVAALVLMAGCGAPSGAPGATETPSPTPATHTPTPTPQSFEVPMVVAVHHSRGAVDIPQATARRLLAGESLTWADLGQPGDAVGYATGAPADAVQQVTEQVDSVAVLPATAVDARVRVLTVDGVHPLQNPDAYPLRTTVEDEPGSVVTLTVVGDIMLGRRVGQRYADDLSVIFEPFAERLAASDITVGNLESTLSTNGEPTQGGDSFAADPAALDALQGAGFDAVTLANNHVGDYGRQAMLETFDLIDESGLGRFGAGTTLSEAAAPWIVEVNGVRVAFIGTESIGETPAATDTDPGTNRLNMPPRTPPLDEDALTRITGEITETTTRAEVVIVMPHWGTQYTYDPEPIQREIAARFVDAGADLVLGGHPHQVQGWEAIGETPVVYSLPNFVFDMTFSRQVQEGMFVEIVLWGDRVLAVEPVPYRIIDHIPQPTATADGDRILAEMRSTGRGPYAEP